MKFQSPKSSGNKNFLKLKSGESARGVFRGDPYEFHQHWINNSSTLCTGKGQCENCKEGNKPNFRFRLNFVMSENGALVAKVFEQGWKVYDALRTLHESDYNLEKTMVKVTRHGSGTDTVYSVIPVPNGTISTDQEKKLSAVKLIELSHGAQSQEETVEETESDSDEDLPF